MTVLLFMQHDVDLACVPDISRWVVQPRPPHVLIAEGLIQRQLFRISLWLTCCLNQAAQTVAPQTDPYDGSLICQCMTCSSCSCACAWLQTRMRSYGGSTATAACPPSRCSCCLCTHVWTAWHRNVERLLLVAAPTQLSKQKALCVPLEGRFCLLCSQAQSLLDSQAESPTRSVQTARAQYNENTYTRV